MFTPKELKQQVKDQFIADQAKKKQRKAEISAMPEQQKKAAKTMDREEKKKAKQARKEAVNAMEKQQKKTAKSEDKYYKKLKNRPISYSVLALCLAGVLMIGNALAPLVGDIQELMNVEINNDSPEGVAAREAGELLAKEITDEGIVLLKNTENVLPLADKKLNIFGAGAFEMRLAGGGSGAADVSRAINFFDSLDQVGITYNQDLYKVYEELGYTTEIENKSGVLGVVSSMLSSSDEEDEPSLEYLTQDVIENAQSFSENALIVLTSDSVEASDAKPEQLTVKGNKLALIEKVCENFENVIIVVNAGNMLELGFVEEYASIKAVLSIGTPGATGPMSLAQTLAGELNPSGRLVDTLVYDNTSAPASENFGDYKYENVEGIGKLEYEEGIYVGYRYYETRYKDDEGAYQDVVLYPFGHGLSYTEFEWEVANYAFDQETIRVEVKVTNTGDTAGKDVVQVYYEPPYYDGGIEKSAVVLADYAKTELLQPGASQTLVIEYPTRQMASWDMHNEEAYVLEHGQYQINVSRNVHDTVESMPFELAETIVYKESLNGYAYKNQFEYANGDLTYLSRADWEGTYPTAEDISLVAPQDVVENYYAKPAKGEGELPNMGADHGIMLSDLRGLEYNDPQWELFLDQFVIEEMVKLFTHGGWKTLPIERLGVPATVLLDGPAGINFFFKSMTTAAYPSELTLASTWNDALIYKMGEAMGTEANAYGVHGIYAPAMNIHRSAYGGRNFEYFSEDPLLSGRMGTAIIEGIQSKNVLVTMKHFILNEQEVNARTGLFLWTNEQAMRELYLKPFEYATSATDVSGVMSSFIHLGYKWAGGNPELLQNVLRGEWGFDGIVSSDAYFSFMDANLALRYGNELILSAMPTGVEKEILAYYKEDPVGIATGLRDRVHTICYTILNRTNAVK